MTIEIKAAACMLYKVYKVVVAFKSVCGTRACEHKNEYFRALISPRFIKQLPYNNSSLDRSRTQCMSDGEIQPSLICENLYIHHNYLPGQAAFCIHVWTQYNPR